MTKVNKRVAATVTALALALTLSACNTEDDPNGTDGDTGDTGVTTTILGDVTTTTLDFATTTSAP